MEEAWFNTGQEYNNFFLQTVQNSSGAQYVPQSKWTKELFVRSMVKWSGLAADSCLYYGEYLHLSSLACFHDVHRDKLTSQKTFRAT